MIKHCIAQEGTRQGLCGKENELNFMFTDLSHIDECDEAGWHGEKPEPCEECMDLAIIMENEE
jgi:hypothetical protein